MLQKCIKLDPKDNVAVALQSFKEGENVMVEDKTILLKTDVSIKHKIALQTFNIDDKIIMYGVVVGKVTQHIQEGESITTNNISNETVPVFKKNKNVHWNKLNVEDFSQKTFMGYHREDGQVGTQNIWLFFPLVFCENRNIETLKEVFEKELLKTKENQYQLLLRSLIHHDIQPQQQFNKADTFDNIKVKFLTHTGGCGGDRNDAYVLARLLAGYLNNPNVAGATILSLGCQNLQIPIFQKILKEVNPHFQKPLLIYEQQKMGSIDVMLNQAIVESFEQIKKANQMQRKPAPLSQLKIGLKCGGSDGFSGISANPVLGYVSDLLVSLGGSSLLCEFPELCGVEQELVDRCVDEEKANKFLFLMKQYKSKVEFAGSSFDMNPSPGNIRDGLITDAMKSAGAAKKGGTSPIVDVLNYAEQPQYSGLQLLCTPGNDVESTTAMAGSGANIILFTTGLGTPTGNVITPVIKVSSNNQLVQKMPDIIDFNTGDIIEGKKTIPQVATALLDFIIKVASGEMIVKAEQLNQNDFIPWKMGVSL